MEHHTKRTTGIYEAQHKYNNKNMNLHTYTTIAKLHRNKRNNINKTKPHTNKYNNSNNVELHTDTKDSTKLIYDHDVTINGCLRLFREI